jgi:DNA-binding transcriptional MerR regulator
MRLPGLFDPPAPSPNAPRRASKSAEAFRTISEVAGDLEVPQHVLRFWESKFPQIKPLKRAGGRRYYRPDDIALLRRIRQCLYDQGYTIKGVQKLLREGALKGEGRGAASAPMAAAQAVPRQARQDAMRLDNLRQSLIDLRRELVALRDMLAKPRR